MAQRNHIASYIACVLAAAMLHGCQEAIDAMHSHYNSFMETTCENGVNLAFDPLKSAAMEQVESVCAVVPDLYDKRAQCLEQGSAKVEELEADRKSWQASCKNALLMNSTNWTADPSQIHDAMSGFLNSTDGNSWYTTLQSHTSSLVDSLKTTYGVTTETTPTSRLYKLAERSNNRTSFGEIEQGTPSLVAPTLLIVLVVATFVGLAAFGVRRLAMRTGRGDDFALVETGDSLESGDFADNSLE
jgi:hypothetical protein